MQAYIQVDAVSKSFGSHRVLSGLSLSIGQGESVAITGPSGCGKTTLLNILGLLEAPDEGVIRLRGTPYPRIEGRQAVLLRRHEVNYLFQSFALIDDRSVRENLMLALHHAKLAPREKDARIHRGLERVALVDKLDAPVNVLSGGEKQRVAMVRAMIKPGGLILADEPTGSLDARMAQIVMHSLVRFAREAGKTLVVVTHDMRMAAMCDRVLTMEAGRLRCA